VAAASDTAAPQLAAFSFAPTTINTSGGPASITFTLHITDDLSGLNWGVVSTWSPSGEQRVLGGIAYNRISGTAQDGVYQVVVTFPQFSEAGVWRVYAVEAKDAVDNYLLLYTADLAAAGFPTQFTVDNTAATPSPTPTPSPAPTPTPTPSPGVPQPPSSSPSVTLTVSAPVVTWGESVTLSLHIECPSGVSTAGLAGDLLVSADLGLWTRLSAVAFDSSGNATVAHRGLAATKYYQAAVGACGGQSTALSAVQKVVVRHKVTLRPASTTFARRVPVRSTVQFITTARPRPDAGEVLTVTYQVYRSVAGRWMRYAERKVKAGSTGVASLRWTFAVRGRWYVRARTSATLDNATSVWTPIVRYDVR
jgi:hypothetical protein